jgi:uncharacterized protein YjiS (DUF1127 family)
MTSFTRESEEMRLPRGFDNDTLVAEARRQRDEALAGALRVAARAVASLWTKAVVRPFRAWQERERTYRELAMLNEHELQDLGITSGMIPLVVAGKIRAANENGHSTKAA